MAGAVLAHPVAARLALGRARADGLKYGLDVRPCRGAAARHERRPVQRALLAARHARSHVQHAALFDEASAADGVGEQTVAAVDENVAGVQQRQQSIDQLIHRPARFHEHDYLARTAEGGDEFLDAARGDEILAAAAASHQVIDARDAAIEHRDAKSLALHVQRQVLAHHGEADEADVR
jgi:hypothetical protein